MDGLEWCKTILKISENQDTVADYSSSTVSLCGKGYCILTKPLQARLFMGVSTRPKTEHRRSKTKDLKPKTNYKILKSKYEEGLSAY